MPRSHTKRESFTRCRETGLGSASAYASDTGLPTFLSDLPERAREHFVKLSLEMNRVQQQLAAERLDSRRLESRLRESERRHCLMLNEMLCGYALHEIICDAAGKPVDYRFLDANPAFETNTGLAVEDILGKTAREVLPTLEQDWIDKYGSVALGGDPIRFENYNAKLDRYFTVIAYSYEFGRFAVIFNDITDQKRMEAEIRNSSEKIKNFAYCVSHDLKTPAIVLQRFASKLEQKARGRLDNDDLRYCEIIRHGAEEIFTLVDQINCFIQAKELPLRLESVSLENIFADLHSDFADRLTDRTVRWEEASPLPTIAADRLALLRCLRNLVDNALKYGGQSLSAIRIGYRDTESHHVLYVEDDGVGITSSTAEDLFDLFKRLSTSFGTSGSGLGLAIVKEICQRHGGQAWAETAAGRGSVFCMSLAKNLTATDSSRDQENFPPPE